jgi:selT/selW/selH-like putative selenoprotein
MASFGLLFFGGTVFQLLKMEEPELVKWMSNNKMNAFMMVFMMGFFSTQLMATGVRASAPEDSFDPLVWPGAFEVYYNGNVVYSKLESGHVPNIQDVVRSLQLYGLQPEQPLQH